MSKNGDGSLGKAIVSKVDWNQFGVQIAEILRESLRDLVTGASSDLYAYSAKISSSIVYAIQNGRTDMIQELRHQTVAVMELMRLQSNAQAKIAVQEIVLAICRTALQAFWAIIP